jgi:hypothetical protein
LASFFDEHTADEWNTLVACVQSVLDPYDIVVTDVQPASCSPVYWEVAVAGTPGQLGFPDGVLGVAPFAENCAVIMGAPAFAFANVHNDMYRLCWTVAQEFAHVIGLDHELLQRDPMTYFEGCLVKRFAEESVACGESTPRVCCDGAATQSSAGKLRARLGTAPGLLFPDSFEEWDPLTDDYLGSTCHWDGVEDGAPELAGEAPFAEPTFRCGTVIPAR